jgi:hypothetical protein
MQAKRQYFGAAASAAGSFKLSKSLHKQIDSIGWLAEVGSASSSKATVLKSRSKLKGSC